MGRVSGGTSGSGRVGVREVADRAGVAVSSVSRVLSGHPDVSDVMRNRVHDAVAALGYTPDLLAQSLRRGATMTVGFVVGDISNPLAAQIARGAEERLRQAGYSLFLLNSMNAPELDAAHIRVLLQRRVDGLLLSLAEDGVPATVDLLRRCQTPFVLVDRDTSQLPQASSVLSDHRSGLTAAVEHLAGLGHRRIALVNGNAKVLPAKERAAVLRRLSRAHPGLAVSVRSGAFTAEHGEAATTALLSGVAPPTALIAGGNQILPGVLEALRANAVRVPADLSLVTCDEVVLGRFLDPPLATIWRDLTAMGRAAAELLLARLSGEPAAKTIHPTAFHPAPSCAPPKNGSTTP